jgi:hypothetical protein
MNEQFVNPLTPWKGYYRDGQSALKYYEILDTLTAEQMRQCWQETDEKTYWDLLECVPPLHHGPNGFMVGECSTHTDAGAIYDVFVDYAGRFFWRPCPRHEWDEFQFVQQIKKLFFN